MDPAPLPPHERPWRHPSEIGPPDHEPTTTGTRVLVLTTATLSLLAIGLLAVAMLPDRAGMPQTVASTVTGERTAVPASAFTRVSLPMVTPVGDDGFGVTTLDALAGRLDQVEARLPSGEVIVADVVGTDVEVGLAVVALPAAVAGEGLDLAAGDATPDDTVVVHAAEPMIVSLRDVGALDVDEGTPVTDDDGRLVGLCTRQGGVELRTVATLPGPAAPPIVETTVTPPESAAPTTTIAAADSTVPAATAPPSTVVEPTTSVVPTTAAPSSPPTTVAPADPPPTVSAAGDATDGPG